MGNNLDLKITIRTSQNLGVTAGVYVQEVARTLSQFNEPIEGEEEGHDKDGNKIAVKTAGRWLFGVPGYSGHIRIVPDDGNIALYISKDAPQAVRELVVSLKDKIEKL